MRQNEATPGYTRAKGTGRQWVMLSKQLTGPGASSRKYDMLTALGAWALSGGQRAQRLALRLMTLVTARYNWRLEEMSVGRSDIARLWCVDERTVKRELHALKELGFISVKRPGTRGRVTSYRLEISTILSASESVWDRVGPDYAARMAAETGRGGAGHAASTPAASTIVPFIRPPETEDDCPWSKIKARLFQTSDRARYAAWFDRLDLVSLGQGALVLKAPSSFHASYVETHLLDELTRAARLELSGTTTVVVTVA